MKKDYSINRYIFILLLLFMKISIYGQTLEEMINRKIREVKADVGVAIIINSKDSLAINNEHNYPMLSTYKVHQAMKVVDYLREKSVPLTKEIEIPASQLKSNTYSPLQQKYPSGVTLPVSEILRYSLQLSDNNACDILFSLVGGPMVVNRYLESIGVHDCNVAYTEDEMRQDINRAYDNWTTPLEGAIVMEKLFCGIEIGDDQYSSFIKEILYNSKTGEKRIPCLLPKDILKIAHKTGTGPKKEDGSILGVNDIGFIELPNGKHYSIAIFIKDSYEDMQRNELLIAEISEIVFNSLK